MSSKDLLIFHSKAYFEGWDSASLNEEFYYPYEIINLNDYKSYSMGFYDYLEYAKSMYE